jgi:hypothetical protein
MKMLIQYVKDFRKHVVDYQTTTSWEQEMKPKKEDHINGELSESVMR